jgi:multisubunit Na+/H+ antiporter MnhE subunit
MKELEVTWEYAIKLWWSLSWRTSAFSLLGGFILTMILTILTYRYEEIIPPAFLIVTVLIYFFIGLFCQIFTLKKIVNKKFKHYKLTLVSVDANNHG